MTVNPLSKKIFFAFFTILLFLGDADASKGFERSRSIMDIGKTEGAKMVLLEKALDLESLKDESSPQQVLYARLLNVRDGTADGRVKSTDIATYMTLMIFLQDIVSPEESLDQRAALNRANAMVALADLASQNEEKRHFYHEAYYLYTLLSNTADQPKVQKAASHNAQKLLKSKKIKQRERVKLEEAGMLKPETLAPIVSSAVKSQFDSLEEMMNPFLAGIPEMVSHTFQSMGVKLTPDMLKKMQGMSLEEHPGLLSLRKEHEKKVTDQVMSVMSSETPRDREEQMATLKSVPKILLEDVHLEAMSHLLGQVYLSVKETPLLRGRTAMVVPVGRSVSWLVELHKALDSTLKTGIEFKPILASGLRTLEPTTSQKVGYKKYLDSRGFDELEEGNVELIFLDVSESGQTLISIKNFVEELYPGLRNKTQHFAILYGEETTDLPCARVTYMPHRLRPVMFAKHDEKQYYCLRPTFYPHDWETPEVIDDFVIPKGALEWQEMMRDWAQGEGAATACRRIQEVLEPEVSL